MNISPILSKYSLETGNMVNRFFGITYLLICLVVPALSFAQTDTIVAEGTVEGDPLKKIEHVDAFDVLNNREVDKENQYSLDFTPRDVQNQKRYRPTENDILFPRQWWRRMFVGVGGGMQVLGDNVSTVSNSSFNAFLGYHFSPIHSLRLSGSYIKYHFNNGYNSATSLSLGIDYLTNLTNFAWGYNPSRLLDVSTVLGAGVRYTNVAVPGNINPYAHMGINLDMHISRNFSLFFEPYVGVQREMNVLFGRANQEKWNLMYGFSGGMQVSLENRTDYFAKSDSIYKKLFFDSSIGIHFPGTSGGLLHRSGVAYQGALGFWINPMLGIRAGLQAQSSYWNTTSRHIEGAEVTSSNNHIQLGGRAEIMLNPLNFFRRWRNVPEGHDFDLNLLFGGDLGWDMKNGVANSTTRGSRISYYGFTTALQALYRVNKSGTYIYLEPRYLATYPNTNRTESELPGPDHGISISVGSRVYMTDPFRFNNNDQSFKSHWWAGLDIGGVKYHKTSRISTGGLGINPSLGLSVGYDLSPYASFRGQLIYQRLYDVHTSRFSGYDGPRKVYGYGLWDSSYDVMDWRLSYMLNINNLLQGYEPGRKFNLWWNVGPSLSYIFNQSDAWVEGQENTAPNLNQLSLSDSRKGNFSPGFFTSLMAALSVTPQYDITVEAMGQYNLISGTNPGRNPRLNNVKYGLTVGTRYHFSDIVRQRYKKLYTNRYFFDSSFGWATSSLTKALALSGTQYNAALGMWFHPVIGARLGVSAQTMYSSSNESTVNGVKMRKARSLATGAGRAELLVNPLNLFNKWREKAEGHDFDVNLLVGLDLGGIARTRVKSNEDLLQFYHGVTGAMQLLYRINKPGSYIYLEPRLLSAYYKMPYYDTGIYRTVSDKMFSIALGSRVYIDNPSFVPSGSDEMVSHWWAGIDFGGIKLQKSASLHPVSGVGFNPSVSMSVGYDFKPLASFRAQLAYQNLGDNFMSGYSGLDNSGKRVTGNALWNNRYNIMDLRLGYMFNINNFLQGYDSKRRFNLWLIAGPSMSWIMSESNNFVEGQNTKYVPLDDIRLNKNFSGKVSPAVTASMMASLKVAEPLDITAEVMGQYNIINGTNPGNNSLLNSLKYGASVGARYHIKPGSFDLFDEFSSKPWHKGWQLEGACGWAFPLDAEAGMHGSGTSMFASVGYWFNSLLGARIGFGGQQTYWNKKSVDAVKEPISGVQVHAPYSIYKTQMVLGGRAELMFNPLNLIRSRREGDVAPTWDMNMSLGMNFGGLLKVGALTSGYVGFTGSVSALYRLSDELQLFVEPRYDVFNYSKYNNNLKYDESFSDRMFTVSVGARISRPTEDKEDSSKTKDKTLAHRGYWVGLGMGGSKMIQTLRVNSGGSSILPSIAASAGYDFNRYHTLRASLGYDIHSRLRTDQPYTVNSYDTSRQYKGTMSSKYHQLDVRLLYMLNFANLWTGRDKRNALEVYLETGPVFSTMMAESNVLAEGELSGGTDFKYDGKTYAGGTSMGMAMGVMVAMPITKNWDITAEAMGQYYFNRTFMPEHHSRFINGTKINLSVGTRYNF